MLAALPENDKRKTLQDVYNKAQKAKNGAGDSQGSGLAGLFGGWGAKSSPAAAPTAADAAPSGKKGKGGKAITAGSDPYAFAAAKLSAADFKVFQTRTSLFARGGINARCEGVARMCGRGMSHGSVYFFLRMMGLGAGDVSRRSSFEQALIIKIFIVEASYTCAVKYL